MDRSAPASLYRRLQEEICSALEEVDGAATFSTDDWQRPAGGGGTTRVLAGEGVFEKAAVNFSEVWGDTPDGGADTGVAGSSRFYATGISLIVHPRNPHVPSWHANLRYLEADQRAWFGGGTDLTPYYLYREDARHFHRLLAEVCSRHPVADYPAWKEECDRYFFLPHRGERRGVGGIFFDHLGGDLDQVLALHTDLGEHLLAGYLPIVERRRHTPYGEREELWQLRRRGRYAEFNLVWDRGTRFGLETGGRTESILASLPPRVRWDYGASPDSDSPEAELLAALTGAPISWV